MAERCVSYLMIQAQKGYDILIEPSYFTIQRRKLHFYRVILETHQISNMFRAYSEERRIRKTWNTLGCFSFLNIGRNLFEFVIPTPDQIVFMYVGAAT